MLNFLRRLLSPDIRQARRLLRNGTDTAAEALQSADTIKMMPSYSRHQELRMLRVGCLLNGMGCPEEAAVECARVGAESLVEFELVDFAAEALRFAIDDTNDQALRDRLESAIANLPGIHRIKVVGELYDPTRAKTAQDSKEETRMILHATSTGPALQPAYRQYKAILESRGYKVDGKLVNEFYELCLFSTWA